MFTTQKDRGERGMGSRGLETSFKGRQVQVRRHPLFSLSLTLSSILIVKHWFNQLYFHVGRIQTTLGCSRSPGSGFWESLSHILSPGREGRSGGGVGA